MSQSNFLNELQGSLERGDLRRLTLSRPSKTETRKTVSFRPVEIGGKKGLQALHRYPTQDQVENLTPENVFQMVSRLLGENYSDAHLETNEAVLTLRYSRKGVPHLSRRKVMESADLAISHDRKKKALLNPAYLPWLFDLGLANEQGNIFTSSSSKWSQVQRFVELLDHAFRDLSWSGERELRIYDMGCGKGYLTFAIEAWLTDIRQQSAQVVGLEQRAELVNLCEATARKHARPHLRFEQGTIAQFSAPIDVLIALHACDTATDDALALGIQNRSQIIVCAPCCQHELRSKMTGSDSITGLLDHGLLRQRQAALVTDALRTLILEREGYQVRVVEFVGSEHTDKNLLLIATRSKKKSSDAQQKIDTLKMTFGLEIFHLESLLS